MIPLLDRLWRAVKRAITLPVRATERLLMVYVERDIAKQKSLVERGPESAKRLIAGDLAFALAAGGALVAYSYTDDSLWSFPITLIIGGYIGRAALRTFQVATTYKLGWIEGRARMATRIHEAAKSGGNVGEVMKTEAEHDLVMTGLYRLDTPDDLSDET